MSEKMPKGWKKYKFIEIADIIGGGTPSKKNPKVLGRKYLLVNYK